MRVTGSWRRRPALLLSGLACLLLSGAPAGARQPPDPLADTPAPGRAVERIAPAQVVLESAHFQVELELVCNPLACFGDFPRPGVRRQVTVTRVSCLLRGTLGSVTAGGSLQLRNADYSGVLTQWLPAQHSSPDGFHTLNRAVDLRVAASQHLRVTVILASGTTAEAHCTAAGTIDRLP